MIGIYWMYIVAFLVLPCAFLHGWWIGHRNGTRDGANAMFDYLSQKHTEILLAYSDEDK
jgi:lipopolysaccharide biosynthesis regulator YciM